MFWLSECPLAVVVAHGKMMERIAAEESMESATVAAVGHATESGDWVAQQWREWNVASGAARVIKGVPSGIGIGVRKVARRG